MRTFAYDAERFADLRKIVLRRSAPIALAATAVGLYLGLLGAPAQPGQINMVPIIVPLVMLLGLFSLWRGLVRGIDRQRVLYESYRLTIDDGGITRVQLDTPTIYIANEDVSQIAKGGNGSYAIKGRNEREVIAIDARINNRDELEQLLLRIRPFDELGGQSLTARFHNLPSIAVICLLAAVYFSDSKMIVTLCGVPLIGVLVWALLSVRKSRNIDDKTRRSMYFVLLPVFWILARLFDLWS
ncbi:MAG TPA: hypothetical protein VIU93_08350 [Gallionellaceae bacterium]